MPVKTKSRGLDGILEPFTRLDPAMFARRLRGHFRIRKNILIGDYCERVSDIDRSDISEGKKTSVDNTIKTEIIVIIII